MYFDDIYMEDIRPATRVSEYVAEIIEFCLQDSQVRNWKKNSPNLNKLQESPL